MNLRKPIDYCELFAAVEGLLARDLPQVTLYAEIGRAVCTQHEKGAAVAAAEYLQNRHVGSSGFSPRNVRRMRDFYRTYEGDSNLMEQALNIGWTQNVLILELCSSNEERAWYIQSVRQYGWSKLELKERIAAQEYLTAPLDETPTPCYTEQKENSAEGPHDEDIVYLPRQYLQEPNGGVCDEGYGEEGWGGRAVRDQLRRHQPGGDRKPGVSAGLPPPGRT